MSASLELFAKRGYSATTTEEIANKARISKGLIFAHFPTKQDLLLAILDEEIERILPVFSKDNDPRPAKERFISLVNSWLEVIKTRPLLVRLSLQLSLDEDYRKVMKKKGKQYFEVTFARLNKLLQQLGSNQPELDCFLFMFFSMVSSRTTLLLLTCFRSMPSRIISSTRCFRDGKHRTAEGQ